jgi:HlyD family secretion protein
MMNMDKKKWLIWIVTVLFLLSAAIWIWQRYETKPDGHIVSGNGRIEATEIDVSAKSAGRIKEILVREGDFVNAGQVVAIMDTEVLAAQHREAQAHLQQMRSALATARSQLVQREAEKAAALAVVVQRKAELNVAKKRLARSSALAAEGAAAQQEADDDQAHVESGAAAVVAAHAQVAAAEAAITTAKSQIKGAEANIEEASATVERIQADIADCALKAPRDGRVQYRVSQPGEVIGSGGRVLNLVDLSDVYMTFFLPTAAVGRVSMHTEVRLVLDAAPQYVIPAGVSFVADVAQFTPKTVETADEREKLMFRVRATIPADLLRKHIFQVKTGLPGMAYVRLDPTIAWPAHLEVRVPE